MSLVNGCPLARVDEYETRKPVELNIRILYLFSGAVVKYQAW